MKNRIILKLLLSVLFVTYSPISTSKVSLNPWIYKGGDTATEMSMGVLNLTNPEYEDDDFIHMALEYISSPITPISFHWSTLELDDNGAVLPDPDTGFDANVAYVSADFSPATWDGVALPYNEFDQACYQIIDLTASNIRRTGKCKKPRSAAVGRSPNIAYAVIYLNTNGNSAMLPARDKRRHLLTHEMGHVFGMGHSNNCFKNTPSTSIMVYDSEPSICKDAPIILQQEDDQALESLYNK